MGNDITSIREALLHEALKDVDGLIDKIEHVDVNLSTRIEAATKEAVARSCQSAQANFKAMIEEREGALLVAGQSASALINAQFNSGVTQLIGATEALDRKIFRLLLVFLGIAVVGGAIGGMVLAKIITGG